MGNDKALIAERALSRYIWYALFLVVGTMSYEFGDLHAVKPLYLDDPLKDIGSIIVGAIIISILFGWIAERVVTAKTKTMIQDTLTTFVTPYIEISLEKSLRDYKWECWLFSPPKEDPLPDHYYQNIIISFFVVMPKDIKFVGAISDDDDALKEYFDDDQVFLRWPMTIVGGTSLTLEDKRIFDLKNVFVDERRLENRKQNHIKTAGGNGIIYSFSVPHEKRNKVCRLEFEFYVRKFVPRSEMTNVITRLYRHVTSASFKLHLDRTLNAKDVFIYTTETTPLYRDRGVEVKKVGALNGEKFSASADFIYPLQPGSNIRFEIRL